MVAVVGFRAWITNNPAGPGFYTVESADASAADFAALPDDGHQGLVLYLDRARPDGKAERQLLDGRDFYFRWDGPDGTVWGVHDRRDEIAARYPGAIIKQGRSITLAVLEEIGAEMMAATDCPGCRDD